MTTSHSTHSPILIIGSTGKTGRRIAQRLTDLGLPIREGSRTSKPAFDWENPGSWKAAMQGVASIYISFFPDLAVESAPPAIEFLTECAKEAGVKQLVLLSGRGEKNAERCENIVRNCGLNFTLIRASWFAQNFDEGHLLDPVLSGAIALPAGNTLEPFVDANDIADVAVAALTDDRHNGQLYEVTGPRLLSFSEAAAAISSACGREVQYIPVSSDAYRAAVTEEVGADFANMLTDLMEEVLDGRNATLGDGVQKALGREPIDFQDYCLTVASRGSWEALPSGA